MAQSPTSSKDKSGPAQFLTEVRHEFEQVTWPTRQEAINLTLIVVGASVVSGVYLGALDYIFTWLVGQII